MTHGQFTQIYLPFSGKMYALAYNLLRNRDEARDCVQDVYSELWIKRDTIEPDKPPLPFVLTMVRNNCLDRLKSRSAQADDETLETLLDHNTENQIEAASDLNAVMQNYRQVLMLNFNVNLDFGTKHREGWKRIDNEDTESGILSGTKKYYIYQFCRIVRQCALFSCFFLDILT